MTNNRNLPDRLRKLRILFMLKNIPVINAVKLRLSKNNNKWFNMNTV